MPEGDTLYRIATTLRKALAGKCIVRFDMSDDAMASPEDCECVSGRMIHAVESLGKHLLIVLRQTGGTDDVAVNLPKSLSVVELLTSDLVLHTHLRMTGSWHIYRPGEPWRKPAWYAKAVLYTDDFVAPCFSAPVVELLTARQVAGHSQLTTRGPDAIAEDFDAGRARANLRELADLPIGVAIMHQRAMAGVGNVYKSEVLFLVRMSPFTHVSEIVDEALDGIIAESRRLLLLNRDNGVRVTNFGLDSRERHWVYGRAGEPCRICGVAIQTQRQGADGRTTYYCPKCQE
jgi:endonuclease VIII